MPPVDDQQTAPRFGPPTTANPFWRVVLVCGAAFCVSCLLWTTAGFANPEAPGNRWLNEHGWKLIALTGVACVGSSLTAMAVDRTQTQKMEAVDDLSDEPCDMVLRHD